MTQASRSITLSHMNDHVLLIITLCVVIAHLVLGLFGRA